MPGGAGRRQLDTPAFMTNMTCSPRIIFLCNHGGLYSGQARGTGGGGAGLSDARLHFFPESAHLFQNHDRTGQDRVVLEVCAQSGIPAPLDVGDYRACTDSKQGIETTSREYYKRRRIGDIAQQGNTTSR